jgi:pyruvate dehydrogenase E1 component
VVLHEDPATGPAAARPGLDELAALDQIQNRILWLAVRMVHEANSVRPSSDGLKVGGHQASSASVVSILTALYFGWLRGTDLVAVKPHASPAFHAAQYLLGGLHRDELTRLRSLGGLQAYPSRTKDPDRVDFSTGSVGLGAVAPLFCSLADRYLRLHLAEQARSWPERRFVALVGDAELDEGNVWEAVLDEALAGLGNVVWIVDVNRQSLDRVIPGIHVARVKAMFGDAGWHVFDIKYGRRLQACFRKPGGATLRDRIDEMSNEEYQVLIRRPGVDAKMRLIEGAPTNRRDRLAALLRDVPDAELPGILADLGGHDITELIAALDAAAAEPTRPSAIFAYTVKGWRLPFAGDSLNHSALLLPEQVEALAPELGADAADPWAGFDPDSPAGRICRAAADRLGIAARAHGSLGDANGVATAPRRRPPIQVSATGSGSRGVLVSAVQPSIPPPTLRPPADLETRIIGRSSTQQAFGDALVQLARDGGLGARLVTASPDVAISTNLGGWINRVGVFSAREEPSFEEGSRVLEWKPRPAGQHIELGISEMNLFMWLCQFGLAGELLGEPLIPIGTVYDPFICRALDGLIYGLYSGARFILVGTPSGISLSAEGGAHQSTVTPSLGIELPELVTYEPAFGQEVAWALLAGIEACLAGRAGHSTYLRLTTRPIDQADAAPAIARLGRAGWREQVLAGGYRLIEAREINPDLPPDAPVVEIVVSGALVPEAVAAARHLVAEEAAANVIVLTSPGRLFGAMQSSRLKASRGAPLDAGGHASILFPPHERRAPIVAVADAAPHALAFLGAIYGAPVVPLGVSTFGQSGTIPDLYRAAGIDTDHIIEAALVALELAER